MLYIALLHYPVCDKTGRVVTTSIANMDIHDIARAAKTYGVSVFYLINPVAAQRALAEKIINHWQNGYGATFNPDRREALELVRVKSDLAAVLEEITLQCGCKPFTVATGAAFRNGFLTFSELRGMLKTNHLPYLLIFGTGSGIAPEVVGKADYRLEPVRGQGDYNHLAVRSAVAIILDRLLSRSESL